MNELMLQVERVVRPVRAGARGKDRMREELFAHLTSIYEEERPRFGDDPAARAETLRRFGEPVALTAALEETLTRKDRFISVIEGWIGWRSHDSAARHTLRLAGVVLVVLGAFALAVVATWFVERMVNALRGVQYWPVALLSQAALVGIVTVAVYLQGLLYFRMRDALCTGLGFSRALRRTLVCGALISLVVLASGWTMVLVFAVLFVPSRGLEISLEILWPQWSLVALVAPLLAVLYGLLHGPTEIRHEKWARIDLATGPF
jgi:hypothetical protein